VVFFAPLREKQWLATGRHERKSVNEQADFDH
jgi:hypothetical protein